MKQEERKKLQTRKKTAQKLERKSNNVTLLCLLRGLGLGEGLAVEAGVGVAGAVLGI